MKDFGDIDGIENTEHNIANDDLFMQTNEKKMKWVRMSFYHPPELQLRDLKKKTRPYCIKSPLQYLLEYFIILTILNNMHIFY